MCSIIYWHFNGFYICLRALSAPDGLNHAGDGVTGVVDGDSC